MKSNSIRTICIISVFVLVVGTCLNGCGQKGNGGEVVAEHTNISIFLDLSDRLERQQQPSQMYRDTAIIGVLCDYFKKATLGPQILESENQIRVFFNPAPQNNNVSTIANNLVLKVKEKKGKEKRESVEGLKQQFYENLSTIYEQTLQAKDWQGCDIWDFFSSGKVEEQCIRKNSRNILVILTDGYLYYRPNKKKDGNKCNFILPEVLNIPDASLMVEKTGLENLEVLMLEVNPYTPQQRDPMKKMLEEWFKAMGVKKFVVAETDVLPSTKNIIENFLNQD